jgi:hypothetical protein
VARVPATLAQAEPVEVDDLALAVWQGAPTFVIA